MKRQSLKAGPELDHRARVGRARRVRTETRLLAAALRVFAEKGPDAPVVDDFVRAAGISRGSFYNHHQSVPELLEATSVWTTEGAVREIESGLEGIRSPAMRLGTGLRLFLLRAESDPVWCRFVARVWKLGPLAAPRRDLRNGLKQGELRFRDIESALDVVLGAVRQALFRIGAGRASTSYRDEVVEMCLQAIGTPPARIANILAAELPALPARVTEHGARDRT